MNRRRIRTTLGIAVLVALALSVFAATSASATGITAFTCKKDPFGTFFGAHCDGAVGEKYKHEAIPQDTLTTGTVTNANTKEGTSAASSQTVHGTLAGVATELTCAEVHGEWTGSNKTNASGEMYFHTEGQLHYTGCEVKKPAGKGCKIAGGTYTTNQLTGTTEGLQSVGSPHTTKVTPKEGTTFTSIKIEGCSIEALNNTFPVTGSLKTTITGATWTATGAGITTQNSLKFGGNKAGVEGALTLKLHSGSGEETQAVTATTG